jgi:hypothetical protein
VLKWKNVDKVVEITNLGKISNKKSGFMSLFLF